MPSMMTKERLEQEQACLNYCEKCLQEAKKKKIYVNSKVLRMQAKKHFLVTHNFIDKFLKDLIQQVDPQRIGDLQIHARRQMDFSDKRDIKKNQQIERDAQDIAKEHDSKFAELCTKIAGQKKSAKKR